MFDQKAYMKVYHRKWYLKNKEKKTAQNKAWTLANKEKMKAYRSLWRKNNPEKCCAYSKKDREHNPGRRRRHTLKQYGLTDFTYKNLLAGQGGVCAICGSAESARKSDKHLHIDHDHVSGKVRGLLCYNCNLMIGNAKDDVERLKLGIIYLNRAYDRTHAAQHT